MRPLYIAASVAAVAALATLSYALWHKDSYNELRFESDVEASAAAGSATVATHYDSRFVQRASAATEADTVDEVRACGADSRERLPRHYQQLTPQDWRALNAWQSERGLSQTRLRTDGELTQEPSAYLAFDSATLRQLAETGDADAAFWLAMQYQQRTEPTVGAGEQREDREIVIPQLLDQAAVAGHVQAMLALGNRYYQQATAATPAGHYAAQTYPDLLIKSRAWQHVADWRMGRLPHKENALPSDLEQQSARLAQQQIIDIQQRRDQRGLRALDNVVPPAMIKVLMATEPTACIGLN